MVHQQQGDAAQQQTHHGEHDDADGERDEEQRPVDQQRVERHLEEQHPGDDGDDDRKGSGQEARHTPPEQVHGYAHRCDIHILERLVMLAVVDDRPGDTPHDRADIDIEGIAQVDVRKERVGEVAVGDDAVHDHQDGGRGERFHHRVDDEQERVGPVGLDLPAQPGGNPERTPGFRSLQIAH